MMNRNQIRGIKERYPKGTLVQLTEMLGERQMPCGLKGTVTCVDDAGQIHVEWENGSSLALLPGEDQFRKLAPEAPAAVKETSMPAPAQETQTPPQNSHGDGPTAAGMTMGMTGL